MSDSLRDTANEIITFLNEISVVRKFMVAWLRIHMMNCPILILK